MKNLMRLVAAISYAWRFRSPGERADNKWHHPRARMIAAISFCFFLLTLTSLAQVDQGTITGTITDPQDRRVVNANVTLTEVDTGFTASATTDRSGTYVFSPMKIGNYSITCIAPGFRSETQSGLVLNVNQRLGVNFQLVIGQENQTITISAEDKPLLQTEDSSVGQVVTEKTLNETPLNGRNYTFIAHFTAGVVQSVASTGRGTGDFSANGQREQQNNYVLDGVDNNSDSIDFLNGASYVVKPPPDALAEFKVQTGNFSAELGHSAGAAINASLKSGTNSLHGDLWEYVRNDALDANSFGSTVKPEYRQNQFGGTIGGPLIKNHLFFFGDVEADRIINGVTDIESVPTALMRQGNFSELLNTSLTGSASPTYLYQPGTGGAQILTCNGQQNVFCTSQIDSIAQTILNLYPKPNTNNGDTYNNYQVNVNTADDTVQWDGRLDWNISTRDQAFTRMSYWHDIVSYPPPLGILDGGGSTGKLHNLKAESFVLSETHAFNPSLVNEFRFGYTYGAYSYIQQNANTDVATEYGLGGYPYTPGSGGFPPITVSSIATMGTGCCLPSIEYQNEFQVLDNVTKVIGKHTVKLGFDIQSVRFSWIQTGFPLGNASYTGLFTSLPGTSFTGNGVADFLANMQYSSTLSVGQYANQYQWYRSGYAQDDWKVTPRLTLNLGLRYDYYQPYVEKNDHQANAVISSFGVGTGTAQYLIPTGAEKTTLVSSFTSIAAKDNISIVYTNNHSLTDSHKIGFAPRVGFAYSVTPRLVVRGAYGLFYAGLQNTAGTNLANNYPWNFSSNFSSATCTAGSTCTDDGITLENGYSTYIANGISNLPVLLPSMSAKDYAWKVPYSESYNLSVQQALSHRMSATVAYVGTDDQHLTSYQYANTSGALAVSGTNTQQYQPFPAFGKINREANVGISNYNSLQATLEKQVENGLEFHVAYTYAHTLTDARWEDATYGNTVLFNTRDDYGNPNFDVRHKVALYGNYQLPFGAGKHFMNRRGILNELAGGWAIGAVFVAQTGEPFTPATNTSTATGANTRAVLVGDPYSGGGSPNSTNPTVTCPSKVKTIQHWFNPCALADPLPGSQLANLPGGLATTRAEALPFVGATDIGQIHGPGYNRMNNSIFKRFATFREQYAEFRADIFNTYNSPAYGQPSSTINSSAGQITSPRGLGNNSPDGRYFQLAMKYFF